MTFPMQAWFQDFLEGLAPRERALLGIGLLVLLPVGLYLYLWQPITAERDRLAVRVGQLRGELVQLRSDGDEVQRLRSQTPIRAAGTLDAIVRLVASRYQLVDKLGTMTPQGNDRLVVNMEGVEFDAWLRWVGELGLQGVSLADCKVEGLPAAGQVRVKATLARSGS